MEKGREIKKSDKEECTVVMYHYVRNMPETDYPEIKGLLTDKFTRQLDYLQENFNLISLERYIDFLNGGDPIPKKSSILTFDDGFKDHYQNVFPLLKERGITGVFFVITSPLVDVSVVVVHKVHFLLAKADIKELAFKFNQILKRDFSQLLDKFFVDDKEKKEKKYRWDDNLTANLKYSIATMPEDVRQSIVEEIFSNYFSDEEKVSKELYMNMEELKEMKEAGMEIGAHTHTHRILSCLSKEEQLNEIRTSKLILENGLREKIDLFSYPYGGLNGETIEVLKKQGFRGAVTTCFGINKGKINPFQIKRLDTNDLPFGAYGK